MAGRFTEPYPDTVRPIGGMKMTSPVSSCWSALVSPCSSRSYRSSVLINRSLRLSWILRNEPIFLTPPLTNHAFVMVDKPLTVTNEARWVECIDQPAFALELNMAQRADLLDAAAYEQCFRHGRQAAHR